MPSRERGLNELMVASNFTEEPSSEFTPPITHYVLDKPKGFEVEFLTNLPGGEYRRDGTPNATVAVAGVTALRLHYVGLLLVAPWTVTVRHEDGYPVEAAEVTVRIPNPVSYVIQKLLIHKDRKGKAAKDVLYIHDTLEAFGDSDEMLADEWRHLRTQMPTKWRERSRSRSVALRSPDHRHVVQAAMIARDAGRNVTADRIAGVVRAGLAFLDEE
jgi:hypothetical protein